MIVAYPLQLKSYQGLQHFLFNAQCLQKLGCKKCPNLANKVSSFTFPEKLLFGRTLTVQKFFSGYVSYTSHVLWKVQVIRATFAEVWCQSLQKCTKTGYPNTFAPRITSLDHKKSKLSRFFGLNFSFVYYKFLKFCPKTY